MIDNIRILLATVGLGFGGTLIWKWLEEQPAWLSGAVMTGAVAVAALLVIAGLDADADIERSDD